jgi:hypothetical protein
MHLSFAIGLAFPVDYTWPTATIVLNQQRQLHATNRGQCTQPSPPTHIKAKKRARGSTLMLSMFSSKKKELTFRLL